MQTLDYHRSGQAHRLSLTLAIITCIVGACGNVLGILGAGTLRQVPIGASIRPMGLVLLLFMIAFGTAGVGLTTGIVAIATRGRRISVAVITFFGIILSLSPLFTSRVMWDHIAAQRGLIMEP